jgi:hypothetical protein
MDAPLAVHVQMFQRDGTATEYAWQNFPRPSEASRTYNGVTYITAGFGFTGTSFDVEGGSSSGQLVFALEPLTLSIFQQAAEDRWMANVKTVWLDPASYQETGFLLDEMYSVTGMDKSVNSQLLTVKLGSPLDAIEAQVPNRVLTQRMVGRLPTSGQILFY